MSLSSYLTNICVRPKSKVNYMPIEGNEKLNKTQTINKRQQTYNLRTGFWSAHFHNWASSLFPSLHRGRLKVTTRSLEAKCYSYCKQISCTTMCIWHYPLPMWPVSKMAHFHLFLEWPILTRTFLTHSPTQHNPPILPPLQIMIERYVPFLSSISNRFLFHGLFFEWTTTITFPPDLRHVSHRNKGKPKQSHHLQNKQTYIHMELI